MYRFGWFSSGRDSAARQLLSSAYNSIKSGDIEASIDFVFLNRSPGESEDSDAFIELVNSYGLTLVCSSYEAYRKGRASFEGGKFPLWRLDYDREIMSKLAVFKPDMCVLAGYMLIVGPEMCRHLDLINLHPAAPGGPAGTWKEVTRRLIAAHETESGVMMHLVTPELDRGPVISYCTYALRSGALSSYWHNPVQPNDPAKGYDEGDPLFDAIRREGLKREFPLVIFTMKALSEGRVKVIDKVVKDSSGKIIPGFDLTAEIDKYLGI
jgi:phosphoribosylglycinamide formyltransferase-1